MFGELQNIKTGCYAMTVMLLLLAFFISIRAGYLFATENENLAITTTLIGLAAIVNAILSAQCLVICEKMIRKVV